MAIEKGLYQAPRGEEGIASLPEVEFEIEGEGMAPEIK